MSPTLQHFQREALRLFFFMFSYFIGARVVSSDMKDDLAHANPLVREGEITKTVRAKTTGETMKTLCI